MRDAIKALTLGLSFTLGGCKPHNPDDVFLDAPIKSQLESAKSLSSKKRMDLYFVAVRETGSTHLSKAIGIRGQVSNPYLLENMKLMDGYIFPNRYLPIIMDTCWLSRYCQCDDDEFMGQIGIILHKKSMYPLPGNDISKTPLGALCANHSHLGSRTPKLK